MYGNPAFSPTSHVCLRSARPRSGLVAHWKDPQGPEELLHSCLQVTIARGRRLKSLKEQVRRAESKETKNVLPVVFSQRSQSKYLIFPQTCDNMYKVLPAREVHQSLGVQEVSVGAGPLGTQGLCN